MKPTKTGVCAHDLKWQFRMVDGQTFPVLRKSCRRYVQGEADSRSFSAMLIYDHVRNEPCQGLQATEEAKGALMRSHVYLAARRFRFPFRDVNASNEEP
jgi:hypothetical protein